MKLKLQPRIEPLEAKALLSHLTLAPAGRIEMRMAAPAVVARPTSLDVTLTTNQTVYRPGQVVTMTFTETNHTGHAVTVAIGPGIDGFFIGHQGHIVWRSNSGFQPQFIAHRILAPGQSITLRAQWGAVANAGSYVVRNQMAPFAASATFRIMNVTNTLPVPPRHGPGPPVNTLPVPPRHGPVPPVNTLPVPPRHGPVPGIDTRSASTSGRLRARSPLTLCE